MQLKAKLFVAVAVAAFLSAILMVDFVSADSSLKRGDKGERVDELQRLLKKHDCFDYGTITGYFGISTENGVRKFQSIHDLDVDGIAGRQTIKALEAAKSSSSSPTSLSVGMRGDEVAEIQRRLKELGLFTGAKITGYFGPQTETAVKLFQQASGTKVDGIVGKQTKQAMFKSFKSDTLAPGMRGESVEKLQERLKKLGYFEGKATGFYGQITEKAVQYYQKLNKLENDGIAGKNTQRSLYSKNALTEKEARRSASPSDSSDNKKPDKTPEQSDKGQSKGEQIVEYAKEFLGVPYVYGGNGPDSFDCTGFTCYVYKHFGKKLPRSAQSQGYSDYGIKITDKSKLMPGDLVFFDSQRDSDLSDHAGIYIGDGKYIHAPSTGSVVKISKMSSRRDFSWGRRVFQ